MPETYPHQLLERYCADRIGRRQDLYGELADTLFVPLVRAVSDQLSIYADQRPMCRLRCDGVDLRQGDKRTFLLARITDKGSPLRLQAVFAGWGIQLESSDEWELAHRINSRRWRFIDRWMGRFFAPMLEQIADSLMEYYARRPHAVPKAGIIRFLEGVDATFLCCEIDDRSDPAAGDSASRYWVQ